MTPKEQKQYLLKKIDEALAAAPDGESARFGEKLPRRCTSDRSITEGRTERMAAYERDKKGLEVVMIEIPGATTFTIPDTKQSLTAFRKRVAALYPVTTSGRKDKPLSALPSNKPTGKRITAEGVEYYNSFKPRKQGIIKGKGLRGNFYAEGWFTNGCYAVKTERPELAMQEFPGDAKARLPDKADLHLAFLLGEFKSADSGTVYAHVFSLSRGDLVAPAEQIDCILTKHPNTEPWVTPRGTIVFRDREDGEIVGLVMPMLPESLEWIAGFRRTRIHAVLVEKLEEEARVYA